MKSLLRTLIIVSAIIFASSTQVLAQSVSDQVSEGTNDPLALLETSGSLMDSGDYEGALQVLGQIDLAALKIDYGPLAGIVPFRKGFCHKMLGKLDEALSEYESCITDFKNTPELTADKRNPVWEICHMEKGAILQMNGDFEEALQQYSDFLKLNYKENYDPIALQIQIAVCHGRIGEPEKAKAILEKLFTPENLSKINNVTAIQGYVALIEAWANGGNSDEETRGQVERDALAFIEKYGTYMNVSPWELASTGQNLRLLTAAKLCVEADMLPFALKLYGMVGTTSDILQDLNTRAASYVRPSPKLLEEIKKYEGVLANPENPDISSLIGVANIYERMKNTRPALGVYEYLFATYPNSKFEPDFLYGAARTARFSEQLDVSEYWATTFLNKYPEHEYAGDVGALLLDKLFRDGEYQRALDTGLRIRVKMPEKSKQRDMPDFVVACSLHYLGRYKEAKPELQAHMTSYPTSRFRETVMYSDAANLGHLAEYVEAKKRLSGFIAEFPKSALKPYARMDYANACYQENFYAEAVTNIEKILTESPDFSEMDRARNLEGDSHYQLKNFPKAIVAYRAAFDLASKGGPERQETAGKALAQLLFIARDEKRNADVVKFYEQYEASFQGLSTEAQVIAASLESIRDTKGKEAEVVALQRLEQVIVTTAVGGGIDVSLALEQSFGTYALRYAQDIGPKELEARLQAFPIPAGVTPSQELFSWISITLIDLYGDKSYAKFFPNAASQIKVSFDNLDKTSKPAETAGYILLKLANNFRDRGGPFLLKADEYYKELIKRGPSPPNNEYYPKALLGEGIMNARNNNPERRKEGITQLKNATKDNLIKEDPRLVEQAMLEAGFAEYDADDIEGALATLRPLWDNKNNKLRRGELAYALFDLYEKHKENDNALFMGANFMIAPLEAEPTAIEVRFRASEIQFKADNKKAAFIIVKDTLQRMWVNLGKEGDPKKLLPKIRDRYVELRNELGEERDAVLETKVGIK